MLLLFFMSTLIGYGSSLTLSEMCYGSDYKLPFHASPPLYSGGIFYRPKGGKQTLVVYNGESKDPRFKVHVDSVWLQELTEQDNGAFLSFGSHDLIKLKIEECEDPETSSYGNLFSWQIPYFAEYLEFSQKSSNEDPLKPVVLWNRTDSKIVRGTVTRNYYEIHGLKQKDSGYYRFRTSKNSLLKWKRLVVKENYRHFEHKEGDELFVDGYVPFSNLKIFFTPAGTQNKQALQFTSYDRRIEVTKSFFSFSNLKSDDSGTYDFYDDENFLALRVEVDVLKEGTPVWLFVVIPVFVLTTILCYCCMKRCCCRKRSNKRNSLADQTEAAAPNAYYHDTSQPTQPVVPLLHREPRVISPHPPTYDAAIDPSPPTQITAPGGFGPTTFTTTSYDFNSSDSEPKFELKGVTFPSAPPLNSDTTISNVYTSDKLNFSF